MDWHQRIKEPWGWFFSMVVIVAMVFFWFANIWWAQNSFLLNLSYLAQILTPLTIIVAILDFRYKRKQDADKAVFDHIDFFTDKIQPLHHSYIKLMEGAAPNVPKASITDIKVFDYAWAWLERHEEVTNQQKRFDAAIKKDNWETDRVTVSLFNALEKLSLKIRSDGTLVDERINLIKDSYIEIIEDCASRILLARVIFPNAYKEIKTLYEYWSPQISRVQPQTQIQQHVNSFVESLSAADRERAKAYFKTQ